AVEQRVHDPPAQRLRAWIARGRGGGLGEQRKAPLAKAVGETHHHLVAPRLGTLPVGASGCSRLSITAPIGSAVPGGTSSGGRSGRRSRARSWRGTSGFRVR